MKKFGKALLVTAALAVAGAGVYYYFKNKKSKDAYEEGDFDDLDVVDDDRSYVTLDEEQQAAPAGEKKEEEADFAPLASIVQDVEAKVDERIEEFFDEDAASEAK